tara:strand:+ start:25 stop:477 length:453 start_codon:yes stop_codon:yes gene_type:complete
MVLPLALAPLIPAGIATLGAGARAIGSPQGQRFLQGGINTLNRFGTRLQDFLQPAGNMIFNQATKRPLMAAPVIPEALNTTADTITNLIAKLMEEEEEDKKEKKKKKKKDEIPEVALKKGGIVKTKKPKKKRKKYKSGTFVKMKGSKRYI